ncbi:hypothetical protein OAO51_02450 [Nitrosomonadaceae bacterium]|nr:hypothetical protein [Nitrosomonadaceae bacterium]
MRRVSFLILITLCGCASTPYSGKYTLNGDENIDYSIEKKQCQIKATEEAIQNLNGNQIGPSWIRARRNSMLTCMRKKGFEWDQK